MSLKSSAVIKKPLYFKDLMVGLTGFEPVTPWRSYVLNAIWLPPLVTIL